MAICINPKCRVETKVLRKGYCNKCSQRLFRNGTLEYKNPDSLIGRSPRREKSRKVDHPMYVTWKYLLKRNVGDVDETWVDLDRFALDVGAKPSERHFLSKADRALPWGPANFFWKEPALEPRSFKTIEDKRAYHRARRAAVPHYHRENRYKHKYGLDMVRYEEMVVEQGGVCAAHKGPETQIHMGKLRPLSVDHDHETGAVRGLLCNNCNATLGHVRDSIKRLKQLITYLEEHGKVEEA